MVFLKSLSKICSNPLPSKALYEKLHSYLLSVSNIHEKCISHGSPYSDKEYFLKLCSIVIKYLTDDVPPDKKINFTCGRCRLFNYWVFHKLIEIFGEDNSKNILAFGKINLILSYVNSDPQKPKNNTCDFDLGISQDNYWKAKREFYEYIEDYHQINIRSTIKDNECTYFHNYIESNPLLHEYVKEINSGNNLNVNSKYYEKNNKCDPKGLLSELMKSENDALEVEDHARGFTAEIQVQDKKIESDDGDSTFLNLPGSSDISGKNIVTTVFPALGTFLSALFFYKFTPVRTWVNKNMGKKNKIVEDEHEEDIYQLLADTSESSNISSRTIPYNISYNPE
ncbi:Plasmodium vivax Vir protein, putative [Plasmodium ovale]|uniref:Plasmodium vivax Vir protein, putative n=1 Tax=Plasmodium ovale TaxID=36330 RepID=A0A1C3KJA6_PLAOA|nr:Plasmodium vivax Vir protein, putative [Plasmodium ovale]